MDLLVYNGAMCMCSFGTAPCPLVILPTSNSEKRCATMMDYNFINLQSFGMCTSRANPSIATVTAANLGALTPMLCLPNIFPWNSFYQPLLLINNFPALTINSKTICVYGGIITILNPGES